MKLVPIPDFPEKNGQQAGQWEEKLIDSRSTEYENVGENNSATLDSNPVREDKHNHYTTTSGRISKPPARLIETCEIKYQE